MSCRGSAFIWGAWRDSERLAAGAEALFDVFATLPGLDMAAVLAALEPGVPTSGTGLALAGEQRLLWQRSGRGMTRV